MNDDKKALSVPHCVSLEQRQKMVLSGVVDVDSFDEECIAVVTEIGKLTVRGENLHIGSLSTDTGDMSIEGRVDAFMYSDEAPRPSGFFTRVFR